MGRLVVDGEDNEESNAQRYIPSIKRLENEVAGEMVVDEVIDGEDDPSNDCDVFEAAMVVVSNAGGE